MWNGMTYWTPTCFNCCGEFRGGAPSCPACHGLLCFNCCLIVYPIFNRV